VLSVVVLNIIMSSAVMLNVGAPLQGQGPYSPNFTLRMDSFS